MKAMDVVPRWMLGDGTGAVAPSDFACGTGRDGSVLDTRNRRILEKQTA